MTESVFTESYAQYYEWLYEDKAYADEAQFIIDRLRTKNSQQKPSILELGCGTGKYSGYLSKGYDYHGIDLSPSMIESAKQHHPNLSFSVADATDFRFDRKFDNILALFHVISYFTDNAQLHSNFRSVNHHLDEGGMFMFDFWYGPAVLNLRPSVRIKRVTRDNVKLTRIAEPQIFENKNVVEVNFDLFVEDPKRDTFGRCQESHNMRYFFLPEIEESLNGAGFKVAEACAFHSGEPLSNTTWGAFIAAEKVRSL